MKTKLSLLFLTLVLTACSSGQPSAPDSPTSTPVTPTFFQLPTVSSSTVEPQIGSVGNTDIRLLPSHVDLTTVTPSDISLAGKPVWVAGIPFENGNAWVAALEDGSLQAFSGDQNGYTTLAISPEKIFPAMPLSIYFRGGQLFALTPPGADASPLTVPINIDANNPIIAYIANNGNLVIWKNGEETRLQVNALPDSRILADENGRLLLLSNPTDRYTHGVLGDELEASSITLVETQPEPRVFQNIAIPQPNVIEGIYPIWTDINNDGEREIIVTLSNAQNGARIVAFREDGSLLAEGPPIGTGFRWRHQLVVAPFGEQGENLLAVVRTPHIGGVVEYYRLSENKLEIAAEIPGISTHSIGSRNLFTAQAGDFDNDGQIELLAPDQSHTRLGIIGLDETSWIDLGTEYATNLAAIYLPDSGNISLAIGLSNNTLRVWNP